MTQFFVGKSFSMSEIKEKCVAIVRFGISGTQMDGHKAGEYFQVTIDPAKISPSGEYIRLGGNPGDEIVGWQKASAITVIEVLGIWDGGESPVMPYGDAGKVTMMVQEKE